MILYEEVFKEFQKQHVKYVLVGGIALNLHGALRNTFDLDILVEMSDENLAKVVKILKRQGYQVRQPLDPMKIADKNTRHEWISKKHMRAFNFYKDSDMKEVDIIIHSPVCYENASKKELKVKVGSLVVPLISMDDLIKMKKAAGRAIDKLDIEELKIIKKLKGKP
ncbi:MAG: nucleotidyltransferase family protein [Chlamydiae bacterium]|nr:nucleotidyltransferase family protein [Chlamydiota bacterium]MBI3276575.1 nucleotidyltransferase family protein [Chlamydiota bacterium]